MPNYLLTGTTGAWTATGAGLPVPEELAARPNVTLVVDATGVGKPVVDMLRAAQLHPWAVTIHGGASVTHEGRTIGAPKRDLVSALQVLLQTGRLRWAEGLPLVPALIPQLLTFKLTIDLRTAHDSHAAWRGLRDDAVTAPASCPTPGRRGNSAARSRSSPTRAGQVGVLHRWAIGDGQDTQALAGDTPAARLRAGRSVAAGGAAVPAPAAVADRATRAGPG